MSTIQEPPLTSVRSDVSTSQLQKPQAKNLPLYLDFTSINDGVTDWNHSLALTPPYVAWNRPSNHPTPAPPTVIPDPDPPATTSFIAKIKAIFEKKKPQSSQQTQQPPKSTKVRGRAVYSSGGIHNLMAIDSFNVSKATSEMRFLLVVVQQICTVLLAR